MVPHFMGASAVKCQEESCMYEDEDSAEEVHVNDHTQSSDASLSLYPSRYQKLKQTYIIYWYQLSEFW